MTRSIFTNEQIDYIKQNYSVMKYKDMAEYLGFTERQIRGKVNNLGLTKLRKFNDDYFENIDTPMKAYLLGFIYADGWIHFDSVNGNYEFGMELQSEDKYILDKINEELGGVHLMIHKNPKDKIINGIETRSGDIDGIRIFSKKIVCSLINNGIVENKTMKDNIPSVKKELFFDFLRGYIDGDGCYYVNKGKIYMHITCCREMPLLKIKEMLNKYKITSRIYKEKENKYRLFCYGESLITLIKNLYYDNNIFCLKRKYEKISPYINGSLL